MEYFCLRKDILKMSIRDVPKEYFCLSQERYPRDFSAIYISTGYLCISQKMSLRYLYKAKKQVAAVCLIQDTDLIYL